MEGGVVSANQNGFFIFINSTFENNFSIAAPIAVLFDSIGTESHISSSYIHDNHIIAYSVLKEEIYEFCTDLCFFEQDFRVYTASILRTYQNQAKPFIFYMVKSKL